MAEARGMLATLAWLGALSSPALAQDEPSTQGSSPPRAYVLTTTVDELEDEHARFGSAARAAFRQVEGIEWKGPDRRYLGYDAETFERYEMALMQLEDGKAAYISFELDRAIELLSKAVDGFEMSVAVVESPTLFSEALLFLGASQVTNGDRRAAHRTFERLHVQMPRVEPDPNQFNAQVIRSWKRAAPRDRRRPRSTIEVESEPRGATTYIDFRPRGRTPVEVEGLLAGDHLVRVTRPGASPAVETRDVRWGRTETVSAFLVDRPEAQGLADAVAAIAPSVVDGVEVSTPLAEVVRTMELDMVAALRFSPTEDDQEVMVDLAIFDAESGRRVLRGERAVPVGSETELRSGLTELLAGGIQRALAADLAEGEREPLASEPDGFTYDEPTDDDTDRSPRWKEWWVWTIVGGVVAAGVATGLAFGLKNDDGPPSQLTGDVVVQFNPPP